MAHLLAHPREPSAMPTYRLTPAARQTLYNEGVPVAAYVRWAGVVVDERPVWRGDSCGCTDDRCTDGYHHDANEECGCLPVLIGQYVADGGKVRPWDQR